MLIKKYLIVLLVAGLLLVFSCGTDNKTEDNDLATDNIDDTEDNDDTEDTDDTEECPSTLPGGQKLSREEHLCSPNGIYQFGLETDGNLVLKSDSQVLWSAGICCDADFLAMQASDGNLVVYNSSLEPLWASNTAGNAGAVLTVENDGRAVIRIQGTELWSVGGDSDVDQCPDDPNKTEPGKCGCGVPEGNCDGDNPFCEGAPSGEHTNQRETGSLSFGGSEIAYELRGGVIAKKHSPNACVDTQVNPGQTQIVTLGTSDGGCGDCKVEEPVDQTLMVDQGFTLLRAVGDEDARTEVWVRVFDSTKANHRKTIAISGDSNAVAWVIAKVDVPLDSNKLRNNLVDSGAGKTMIQDHDNWGWLSVSEFKRENFQFKFIAAFLDDTCVVDEEDEDDHMMSFWEQGDGDTFFVGIWGAGESVKDRIRLERKEDWGFDVAIQATGQNP